MHAPIHHAHPYFSTPPLPHLHPSPLLSTPPHLYLANPSPQKRDIATATATFGFIRNLGSAISIVVGSVIFQNQIASQGPLLVSSLGPETASAFSAGSAGANVGLINTLPAPQKEVARRAFADSLSTMWILYAVAAGVGLLVSGLITRNTLSRSHEETKTGIEVERERRRERERAREEKRGEKRRKSGEVLAGGGDVEKAG